MNNFIPENIEIYKKGIEKNLVNITEAIKFLKMKNPPMIDLYDNLFQNSSKVITKNWESGKKYSRTAFIQNAFGDELSKKRLELLLSVDSMINILDDLLDENLSDDLKNNYVIELLRNFSIYNHQNIPEDVRTSLGVYFDKLITLALSEKVYELKILKSNNFDEIVEDSVDLLICRGMDIDAFTEIALIDYKGESSESIKKAARFFRALNIFKKDINDVPYDTENGMQTVVTIILSKESISFDDYMRRVIALIFKNKNELSKNKIIDNFGEMMKKDEDEIIKSFQNMR